MRRWGLCANCYRPIANTGGSLKGTTKFKLFDIDPLVASGSQKCSAQCTLLHTVHGKGTNLPVLKRHPRQCTRCYCPPAPANSTSSDD